VNKSDINGNLPNNIKKIFYYVRRVWRGHPVRCLKSQIPNYMTKKWSVTSSITLQI